MNKDAAVKVQRNDPDSTGGFVKLYAHGKVGLLFDCPEAYQQIAEECFKRALNIKITVDGIAFVRSMRDLGAPGAVINKILNSCKVFDEVHLGNLSLQ